MNLKGSATVAMVGLLVGYLAGKHFRPQPQKETIYKDKIVERVVTKTVTKKDGTKIVTKTENRAATTRKKEKIQSPKHWTLGVTFDHDTYDPTVWGGYNLSDSVTLRGGYDIKGRTFEIGVDVRF